MRRWLSCIFVVMLVVLSAAPARAQADAPAPAPMLVVDDKNVLMPGPPVKEGEAIPPSPAPFYIVDQAHALKPATVAEINETLKKFERETSNQIVVGIYSKMQSQDDIAAYAVRVYEAWKPGTKSKDNGVLLLIFIDDRKVRIATGYGLEGALPDATAFSIIEHDIKPNFKKQDYDRGVKAAVTSIIAATKGEYKAQRVTNEQVLMFILIAIVLIIYFVVKSQVSSGRSYSTSRGTFYGGRRSSGWSGSSGSSGWSSGSSGGGFSGGGGSTGGGGASGSW
jgi:uncharacterized protein